MSSILTFIAVLVLGVVIYYTHKKREQDDIDFHNNLVESFKEIDLKVNSCLIKLDGIITKLDNLTSSINNRFDVLEAKLDEKVKKQQ